MRPSITTISSGRAGARRSRVTLALRASGRPETISSFGCPSISLGYLITLGDPERVEWYHRGRLATRAEVVEAIESGLPQLQAMCDKELTPARRRDAVLALGEQVAAVGPLLPAEAQS